MSTNWRYPEISNLGRYAKIFGVKWVILNREGFSFSKRLEKTIMERYSSTPLSGVSHVFFGNELAQKYFSEIYSDVATSVIGYPRYDRLAELRKRKSLTNKLVAVCVTDAVLSANNLKLDGWVSIVRRLIGLGFEVEIKLKERGKYRKIEAELIDLVKQNRLEVKWNTSSNALELISRSLFVITGYSQVIAESLALSVPCLIVASQDACELPLGEREKMLIHFVKEDSEVSRNLINKLCEIRSMELTAHLEGEFIKSAIGVLNSSSSEQLFVTLKRLL